jgi:hypothetical protein
MAVWIDGKYSTHRLNLSKNISGEVSWRTLSTEKNWIASFMGTRLGSYDTLLEAKLTVEGRAERELNYALAKLELDK